MPKKLRKMKPKWSQKWCQNGPNIDQKKRLFRERWFCEKLCFSLGKTYFLRFWGSKNRKKIDKKTKRKRASKKWCKIDEKWCQNGAKMEPKCIKNRSKMRAKKKMNFRWWGAVAGGIPGELIIPPGCPNSRPLRQVTCRKTKKTETAQHCRWEKNASEVQCKVKCKVKCKWGAVQGEVQVKCKVREQGPTAIYPHRV